MSWPRRRPGPAAPLPPVVAEQGGPGQLEVLPVPAVPVPAAGPNLQPDLGIPIQPQPAQPLGPVQEGAEEGEDLRAGGQANQRKEPAGGQGNRPGGRTHPVGPRKRSHSQAIPPVVAIGEQKEVQDKGAVGGQRGKGHPGSRTRSNSVPTSSPETQAATQLRARQLLARQLQQEIKNLPSGHTRSRQPPLDPDVLHKYPSSSKRKQ